MTEITSTKDHKVLAELNKMVQDLHHELYPNEFKAFNQQLMEDAFERMIEQVDCHAYLATLDGENVGYMLCFERTREDNAFQYEKKFIVVDQIAVLPDSQGKGVGYALLQEAEKLAVSNGMNHIQINHWRLNDKAKQFFTQQGFKYLTHWMEKHI